MTIIGFNFIEINAKREGMPKGKINIANNISIKDVKKIDLPLGSNKQDGIKIDFVYTADYNPNIGSIELKGEIILLENDKTASEILSEWKKNKKLPESIVPSVFNNILNKSNIEGLIISRDIGLPPLIQLPRIGPKKK